VAAAGLLVLDELGYVSLSRAASELLFHFLAARYQRGSLTITTNLEFREWPQVFGDEKMTADLADRVAHRARIFDMSGESYRFRETLRRQEAMQGQMTTS
jgi:DNA replication protein DnaC